MSQLGAEIHEFLGTAFAGLWVGGEVQRPHLARSGHLYLELVEKGGGDHIVGRLDAVIFRGDLRRIRPALARAGVDLEEGQTLRCFGGLDLYPPSGRLQLVVREIDPLFTVGALAQRRRETLHALERAGLIDANRALPLPALPLRLGLVGSRGSAGVADFLATLEASPWAFQVELVDAAVQGARAELELVGALRRLEERLARGEPFDAFVLVRGGGSRTDLSAFDTRRVAEAVARASRPVLTGLGHEIDESVTDRVAHLACKTPTGVAEHLCQRVAAAERELLSLTGRIGRIAGSRLSLQRAKLERGADRLRLAEVRLERLDRRMAEIGRRAAVAAEVRLRAERRRTQTLSRRLVEPLHRRLRAAEQARDTSAVALADAASRRLRVASERLRSLERLCAELSPKRVLARGFSITRHDDRVVRDAGAITAGSVLSTELERGAITSRVEGLRTDGEGAP
ncbi:MAG TPA: exodeoxyribonuclease VII large subunit [Thermoanaerobaculia bacterium]|nr:exodeoxyribonuclease VII large subunit [Thermoanaerobaculia bacterium]